MRFVGVPRGVLNAGIADMPGWRAMGSRMLEHAKNTCPVSKDDGEGKPGPHLKDTMVAKFIGGPDPRILIGSEKKGDVLTWVTQGTSPHLIVPVTAGVLRWTSGGATFFSASVNHPGTAANPFLMDAIRAVARA